jgi:hypothetical protein
MAEFFSEQAPGGGGGYSSFSAWHGEQSNEAEGAHTPANSSKLNQSLGVTSLMSIDWTADPESCPGF